jgi:hypothetical protein
MRMFESEFARLELRALSVVCFRCVLRVEATARTAWESGLEEVGDLISASLVETDQSAPGSSTLRQRFESCLAKAESCQQVTSALSSTIRSCLSAGQQDGRSARQYALDACRTAQQAFTSLMPEEDVDRFDAAVLEDVQRLANASPADLRSAAAVPLWHASEHGPRSSRRRSGVQIRSSLPVVVRDLPLDAELVQAASEPDEPEFDFSDPAFEERLDYLRLRLHFGGQNIACIDTSRGREVVAAAPRGSAEFRSQMERLPLEVQKAAVRMSIEPLDAMLLGPSCILSDE